MIGVGIRGTTHKFTEGEKLIHSTPPTAYVSNPVLVHPVTYTNTCPAGIMQDPLDATKKLFWRGEFLGPSTVGARISLFTGSDIDDPYDLGTQYGIVFSGSESYDTNGCRFGCPVFMGGTTIWYYYVGIDTLKKWRICRAVSTDGGRTYTKMGVVLDFDGVTESSVSGPSILIEGGTWNMVYTVWSGVGGTDENPGDSDVGIRLATSSDGITWTKTGTTVIPIGTFDNVEDASLYKYGDQYVLMCTVDASTNDWGTVLYTSPVLNATFNKIRFITMLAPPTLTACPYVFRFSDGYDYVYYQQDSENGPGVVNDIHVSKFIPHINFGL